MCIEAKKIIWFANPTDEEWVRKMFRKLNYVLLMKVFHVDFHFKKKHSLFDGCAGRPIQIQLNIIHVVEDVMS